MIAHTHIKGGTPPLIFIHAFGCARSDWDAQLKHFTPNHTVVAVDLGGHGETPAQPDHTTIEAHSQDIIDLLVALNLPPAVVIGNSLGCRVTLDVVDRAPELVFGIALVDGSRLCPNGETRHVILGTDAGPEDYPNVARRMFANMFSPDCDSNIVAEMTKRALAIEPTFGMSLLADIGRHDSEKMERILRGTTVPVLAIQSTYITKNGQRNQLAGSQASPYLNLLRSTVSNLTVDIVTDSGHYPQIEQPEKVNKALSKFLAASTPR